MAREFGVKRLEPAPRAEQQRRGFAAKARGPGDVTADEVRTCSLGLVKRAVLHAGNEPKSSIERPSLEARLRRCERAFRTSRRVHCQRDGPLEESGRRCDSATSLCPASRTLEFGGDFLARSGRCSGAMPGTPIRVCSKIGRLGEGPMDSMAVLGSGRAIGGGPHEWVRELNAPTDFEQTRVYRRVGGSHVDAERLGGTVEQYRIAERLCGRGEDEQSRLDGKQAEPPNIALFDLAPHRLTGGQPESTGEVCNVPAARQLKERERIAVALGDDLVTDRGIKSPYTLSSSSAGRRCR
jgi:hypothetical protein